MSTPRAFNYGQDCAEYGRVDVTAARVVVARGPVGDAGEAVDLAIRVQGPGAVPPDRLAGAWGFTSVNKFGSTYIQARSGLAKGPQVHLACIGPDGLTRGSTNSGAPGRKSCRPRYRQRWGSGCRRVPPQRWRSRRVWEISRRAAQIRVLQVGEPGSTKMSHAVSLYPRF